MVFAWVLVAVVVAALSTEPFASGPFSPRRVALRVVVAFALPFILGWNLAQAIARAWGWLRAMLG